MGYIWNLPQGLNQHHPNFHPPYCGLEPATLRFPNHVPTDWVSHVSNTSLHICFQSYRTNRFNNPVQFVLVSPQHWIQKVKNTVVKQSQHHYAMFNYVVRFLKSLRCFSGLCKRSHVIFDGCVEDEVSPKICDNFLFFWYLKWISRHQLHKWFICVTFISTLFQ